MRLRDGQPPAQKMYEIRMARSRWTKNAKLHIKIRQTVFKNAEEKNAKEVEKS